MQEGVGGVGRRQAAFVPNREPRLAQAGVDFPGNEYLAIAPDRQLFAVLQEIGKTLLSFQDQGAVVHAAGGQQVDQRGFGAATVQFPLKGLLCQRRTRDISLGDALDIGRQHR